MNNILDTCLADFVDQLQAEELVMAVRDSFVKPETLYAALINNQMQTHAGPEGLEQVSQVSRDYFKGVELCRASQLPLAYTHLQQCDTQLAHLPAAAKALATLTRNGAWSNYYYKAQEGEQAIEVLRQGFVLSAEIERQGCPAFLYWRIGHLFNIVTVLFRSQEYEAGYRLLKNALIFVHSGQATDLLTEDWNGVPIDSVPVLQENCLNQLFGQLALQNMRHMSHDRYGDAFYHAFFFRQLLLEMEAETYNRTVIYNWMYAKASYAEQGIHAFLENTLEFLTDTAITREYDLFKVNLLAQVKWLAQQEPHNTQLAERIQLLSDTAYGDLTFNLHKLKQT